MPAKTDDPVGLTARRRLTVSPGAQSWLLATNALAPTAAVMAGLLTKVHVAPASTLRYTPEPAIPAYSRLRFEGSETRSSPSPAGRPETPSPESLKKETPPSLLRQMPPPVPCVATTRICPRAARPRTSRPARPAPVLVQLAPPSVVRIRPVRTLPT